MPAHMTGSPRCVGCDGAHLFASVVAIMVAVLGAAFALLVPAGAGLDEPMHIARVEQLAEGTVLPQRVELEELDTSLVGPASDRYEAYGGETDSALYELIVLGNKTYFSPDERAPFSFPTWEDERLSVTSEMGESSVTWLFPNSAINSPVSYAPYVMAFWVARALTASPLAVVLAMRLTGVVTLAVTVYACIRLLPVGRRILALIALLPCTLSVNSMVTADLMTLVCATVYFSCLVRMLWDDSASRARWVILWASLFGLCLAKVTYAPFGLLLFLLPLTSPAWRSRDSLVRIGLVGCTSLVAFFAWYFVIHDINTGFMWSGDIDPDAQAAYVAANPLGFLATLLRSIAATDVLALGQTTSYTSLVTTSWMSSLVLGVALVTEALGLRGVAPRRRPVIVFSVGVLLVSALIAVLVFLALYLQFTAPGASFVAGVQSRYFLPVILPVCLGLLGLCSVAAGGLAGRAEPSRETSAGALGPDVPLVILLGLYSSVTAASLVATMY